MKENLMGKLETLKPTESIGGDSAFEGLDKYVTCKVLATPKKQPGGTIRRKSKTVKNQLENPQDCGRKLFLSN